MTGEVINIDYIITQPPWRDLSLANSLEFDVLKTGRRGFCSVLNHSDRGVLDEQVSIGSIGSSYLVIHV